MFFLALYSDGFTISPVRVNQIICVLRCIDVVPFLSLTLICCLGPTLAIFLGTCLHSLCSFTLGTTPSTWINYLTFIPSQNMPIIESFFSLLQTQSMKKSADVKCLMEDESENNEMESSSVLCFIIKCMIYSIATLPKKSLSLTELMPLIILNITCLHFDVCKARI